MRSKEVPEEEIEEAGKMEWQYLRMQQRSVQAQALEEHGVDTFGASAVRRTFSLHSVRQWLVLKGADGCRFP